MNLIPTKTKQKLQKSFPFFFAQEEKKSENVKLFFISSVDDSNFHFNFVFWREASRPYLISHLPVGGDDESLFRWKISNEQEEKKLLNNCRNVEMHWQVKQKES